MESRRHPRRFGRLLAGSALVLLPVLVLSSVQFVIPVAHANSADNEVAVAAAGLTVYDMLKAAERGIRIENIRLVRKSGGKTGSYVRREPSARRAPAAIRRR